MGKNERSLLSVRSDDRSIVWPSEIDFKHLDIEYTMGLRAVEWFGFFKGGPHPCFLHEGCSILPCTVVDLHRGRPRSILKLPYISMCLDLSFYIANKQ